jgi:hypothetical protein
VLCGLLLGGLLGVGCSDKAKDNAIGSGSDQNDDKDAGNKQDSGSDDDIGGNPITGGGIIDLEPTEICKTVTKKAEQIPVDIYVMLDQSISMAQPTASGVTRWEAVTDAISAFVQDDRATGIGVGIDYFGVGYISEENCKAENYADPDVEIAQLPGNRDAIVTSLANALGPESSSKTPTFAALDGALQYATAHARQIDDAGVGRLTAVLLASDGFPTECDQSLPAISQLAADAFNDTPPVRTYFISLTEGEANAKAIAAKGGGRAFIIKEGDDVKAKFLDAMLSVTTAPLSCSYDVTPDTPDGGIAKELNGDRAAVSYTSGTGTVTRLPLLTDSTQCQNEDKDGFYLTPADKPTRLTLCKKTCSDLGAGELRLDLVCKGNGGIN